MPLPYNRWRGDIMKVQWKKLSICLAVPLAAGGASAFLTKDNMQIFESVNKPPLSPPGWLFPTAWTILYLLMGYASYLAVTSGGPDAPGMLAYGIQLIFNFFWPIFFFNRRMYLFSFFWLVVMWLVILTAAAQFYRYSRPAGYLLVPYLLWVAFAGYLNLGIYLLN